jgi:hypothetical protein
MTNEIAGKQQCESTNQLKSIFEQSLAVLCEDKPQNKNVILKNPQNVRIRRDFLPLHIDAANLQKRALDDAAKALAALWKISEPGRAKPPCRAMNPYKKMA